MKPEYIVVQAGGKGTRLGKLTANKPKALVPIGNLPMLFYLFRQFPEASFIIIADYKADVMRKYLAAFAKVDYLVVDAEGHPGTCGGIRAAMEKVPDGRPLMLIWSDLVLPGDFAFPGEDGRYVGLSKGFPCRWRYVNGKFEEIPSEDAGVAGLFLFPDKRFLADVPEEGEFVRWLQIRNQPFRTLSLPSTKEYGVLSSLQDLQKQGQAFACRPFNRITAIDGDKLVKEGIDAQGKALAAREKAWYRTVSQYGFRNIPVIYGYEPFVMQRIAGQNIFNCPLDRDQKRIVLEKLIQCLRTLHSLGDAPCDSFSIYDAYVNKTWQRLDKVRDMIPFAQERTIRINGKECRNVFFYKRAVESHFEKYRCGRFALLHGDNTFSNMMLDKDGEPILIDPRGYFGRTELYGDPAYDWAKLYYSIRGNYDQFNLKRFELNIGESDVRLEIQSNGWEEMEDDFFSLLNGEADRREIQYIHAIIWLSLTTYAWEDYDSICGAFYNGLYYLEDVL